MKKIFFLLMISLFFTACIHKAFDREVVTSPNAPVAIGPFSQAIRTGKMLFLAGQLGLDPKTGKFAGEDFKSQARQALENQKAILTHAGFDLQDVVLCQVFVTDLNNYADFNDIYKEYFAKNYPARAVLEISRIPAGGLIEIMMIAVKAPDKD